MCKKVLIAVAAVAVGLAAVKGTWVFSHLRHNANEARRWVVDSVPPEQEIARLRMEVQNLQKDDDRHVDRVARLAVDVEKMEREVGAAKTNLTRQEARLRDLRREMGESAFVAHHGQRYTRDDLRADALSFKTAEDAVKSREEMLQAKRKHLSLERKKLMELQTTRNQMSADLQRLETALVEERQAQASSESTIDDAGYRRLNDEMKGVRDRIELLKKKRELRGEMRPAEGNDRQRQQNAEADSFLEARFGDAGKRVADGK